MLVLPFRARWFFIVAMLWSCSSLSQEAYNTYDSGSRGSAGSNHRSSVLNFTGLYRQYFNQTTGSTTPDNARLASSYEAEMGLRVYRIFSLIGIGGKATDDTFTYGGAGIRVDLPGFLFFGASASDLIRRSKRYPVNTSIHAEILRHGIKANRDAGTAWQFYVHRAGLTIDVVPLRSGLFYLSLDGGVVTIDADSHVTAAAGVGLEL